MKPVIVLFDLDGVLIRPAGYRAAVRASMQYLYSHLNLQMDPPGDDIPTLCESFGITSEWDMVSILLAIILDEISLQTNHKIPSVDLQPVLDWAADLQLNRLEIRYRERIQQLGEMINAVALPSRRLLEAQYHNPGQVFAGLDHQPFLRELLQDNRNIEHSLAMRLVQNYVIGSQLFEQTYGVTAPINTPSLLQTLDQPALSPDLSARILSGWRDKRCSFSAFTARPSLPPRDALTSHAGYSPEAEMALSLVGLGEIPIMGYGHLQWLASRVGGLADAYLKPSAVQPLAAIYAAWTHAEESALIWALDAVQGRVSSTDHMPIPPVICLHVFEDSSIGITGGRLAAEVLTNFGVDVEYHGWGIAQNEEKRVALQQAGVESVFTDVNEAVQRVLLPVL